MKVLLRFFSTILGPALMANPLTPEEEKATFQFADPEMRIQLVASEPDIKSPVAMAWGLEGEIYVAEMPGYPLRENSGVIKRLTDEDGDGTYKQATIFARGLQFPNSVMLFKGGLLVCDAPDILFLKDTNGDGVADKKEVIWSGFKPGNHQLRVNSLYWGLDNWIYGANGRSGGIAKRAGSDVGVSINFHDLRFDHELSTIEPVSGYSQYGLAQDNWGNRFITLNHRFARQVVLEKSHMDRNPEIVNFAIHDTYQTEHDRKVHTLLPKTMRFNTDPVGYFTSLSGLTAYRGVSLGPSYNGSFFAGESVQNCVIQRRMIRKGMVFTAENMFKDREFLASSDGWFHPVNFSNGPDGALYLVDFYRRFVEHPQWAYDELSQGIDWNEGEPHGRIWRVYHKDHEGNSTDRFPSLKDASTARLVQHLENPSSWVRDTAQRLLVEQGRLKSTTDNVAKILKGTNILAKIHLLWALDGVGDLKPGILVSALNDSSMEVQAQAIKISQDKLNFSTELVDEVIKLTNNSDELVRVNAILSLVDVDYQDLLSPFISAAINYKDPWTRVALMSSVSHWTPQFVNALSKHDSLFYSKNSDDLIFLSRLGRMVARSLDEAPLKTKIKELDRNQKLEFSQWALLGGYLSVSDFNHNQKLEFSERLYKQARHLIEGFESTPEQVIDAAFRLLEVSKNSKVNYSFLDELLKSKSEMIQEKVVQLIARQNVRDNCNYLFGSLELRPNNIRKLAMQNAMMSLEMAHSLLDAVKKDSLSGNEIPEEIRRGLINHPDSQLKKKAKLVLADLINPDRQKVIDKYQKAIINKPIDIKVGAKVFSQQCIHCHSIKGVGSQFAPDLTSLGSRDDEFLLTSILDPRRFVSYELKLHVITTKDGRTYAGIISTESTDSKTIRQPNGKTVQILRRNIEKETGTQQSIMPEGFEHLINPDQMASLMGFIRQPDTQYLTKTASNQ